MNVSVALQYLDAWLRRQRRGRDQQPDGGRGDGRDLPLAALAVAGDTRTRLADGRVFDGDLLQGDPRRGARPPRRHGAGRLGDAVTVLDRLVLADDFPEFLTLEAYRLIE